MRQLPEGSALARATRSDIDRWTIAEHLLATVADRLGILIWHNTKDGQQGRNAPKPIPRPGMTDPDGQRFGTPRPIEEVRRILDDWSAPGPV